MMTSKDMERFGGVVERLFMAQYPDGATLEQMRRDAPEHGWIRLVLEALEG